MKKILYIHHATGWGGAPLNMINIIKSLDKKIYQPHVLLIKDSIVSKVLNDNNINYSLASSTFYKHYYQFFIHSISGEIKWYQPVRLIKLSIYWILSRIYFAKKELDNYDFDIIHLNSSVLTDWLKPCSQKGKVVYHVQEPLSKGLFGLRYSFFRDQVKKYADKIIAISEDNAIRINIPEKTIVIYNYSSIPDKRPSENSYQSKKVLYLGGAARIKGFYVVINALDYLNEGIKIYFAGNYDSTSETNFLKWSIKRLIGYDKRKRNAIQKINQHPNAVLIGMINNVEKYYDESCCLLSPFMDPHFSRPVIEAHLHMKPVIGSNVQGMDEIIKHEINGLIVPKNNPKELAKAINLLTADSMKAKTLGEEGYRTAISKFSPNNIKSFCNVYDEIL